MNWKKSATPPNTSNAMCRFYCPQSALQTWLLATKYCSLLLSSFRHALALLGAGNKAVGGGYQVIKKWLSYCERDLLGRSLTIDEAREVTSIARRIAAILLMEPELDGNSQAVKQAPYAWSASAKKL